MTITIEDVAPATKLKEEPVFPLTNATANSFYSIFCVDDSDTAREAIYVLSSNNFAYNNQVFPADGSPVSRNGLAFLASIETIPGVAGVSVGANNNYVTVVYTTGRDRKSAEPKVILAIALGAMGLNLSWVRVTRLNRVAA